MDDSPFTRRNSVDETYNYNYDEQMINVSNTYLRLLHSISDNYNNNLQTYQQLMDRCLTMGFHTQMNVFRLAHLNHRMRNENQFPSAEFNNDEMSPPPISPFIIPTMPTVPTTPTTPTMQPTPIPPSVPPRVSRRTTPTNRREFTNRRPILLNRRRNSISRRLYTEDTPIIPNPFYSHFLFPYEDVVVNPTAAEIENATTILRYSCEEWSSEFNSCPISLENFEEHDEIRKINACGHYFKKMHIDRWFEQNVRCPVCRHDIRNTELVTVPVPDSDSDSDSMPDLERNPIPDPVYISEYYDNSDNNLTSIGEYYDNSDNNLRSIEADSEALSGIIHNEDTLDNSQFQFNIQNLPRPQDVNLFNILSNELENVTNNSPLSYLMNIGITRMDLSNNRLD
tara:strand:- start:21028 stop:22215 length:1188 start_codon:yes stop_codon:yes gene_type:complete